MPLGMFHSDADVARWRSWTSDNMPSEVRAEWDAVVAEARGFESNPDASFWRPPDSLSEVTSGRGGWAEGGAAGRGTTMNRAALKAAATGDGPGIRRVVAVLLRQARDDGWDILTPALGEQLASRAGDAGYRFGFSVLKRVWAWGFVRSDADAANASERAEVDAWFRRILEFLLPKVRGDVRAAWGDSAYDDTFRPAHDLYSGNNATNPVYRNPDGSPGPRAGWYGLHAHDNRSSVQAAVVGTLSALLGHAEGRRQATAYAKGIVVAMIGDRFVTESVRGDGTDFWKAWSYGSTTVSHLVMMAAALAAHGDRTLLDWSTDHGVGATADAGRRGVTRAVGVLADLDAHRVRLHAPGPPVSQNTLIDSDMAGGKPGTTGTYALLERFGPPANVRDIYAKPTTMTQGTWNHLYPGWFTTFGAADAPPPAPPPTPEPEPGVLVFEAEDLTVSASSGQAAEVRDYDAASAAAVLNYASTQPGDFVEFALAVPEAGDYALVVVSADWRNRGVYDVAVDGEPIAAGPIDGYADVDTLTAHELGVFALSGEQRLRFTVVGRHPSANGSRIVLDVATLRPVQAPEPAPDPEPSPGPGPGGSTYVVQPGDTLSGIAAAHDIDVIALIDANTWLVQPGQVLTIPDR